VELDLLVQREPATRQRTEDVPHRRVRVGQTGRRGELGAGQDQLVVGQRLELGAELVAGGDQGRLERDHGGGLGFHRGVAGNLQQPQRLDLPVGGLRDRHDRAAEDLTGGVLGVDGVALARHPPLPLARRPVDLVHGVAEAAEEPGQPHPVGAGALHPEPGQPALDADLVVAEGQQIGEAGCRGGDELFAETAAEAVEHDCDVFVFVGVDADDDIVAPELHAGHGRGSPSQIRGRTRWSGGRTGLR
jgi:hypothetical protein